MFTSFMILAAVCSILIAAIGYYGIENYEKYSEDEDSDTTARRLRLMLVSLVIVIMSSLCIMWYSHGAEKTNNAGIIQKVEK